MRKELIILFFILVFSNFVYAEFPTCDDTQLIMRLESSQNSLASLWDGSQLNAGSVNCPQGMISYWKFDGKSLNDFEGTNHLSVIPVSSSAKYFDGQISDAVGIKNKEYYLEVADNPTLDITGSLTMGAWVYMQTWDGSGKKYILTKNNGADSEEDYAFYFNVGDLKCRIDKESGTAKTLSVTLGRTGLDVKDTSGWHHLVCTYDNSIGELKIYFDGVEKKTLSFSSFSIPTNDNPLNIGKDFEDEVDVMKIDEVALYNRALSQAEITAHYNKPLSYCDITGSSIIYFENQICHDNIFGEEYLFPDPHHETTTCANPIVWLEKSHGSRVNLTSSELFTIPVCYGNVICEAKTSSCAENEKILIKLNSIASPSTASDSTGTGTYNLCCRSGAGLESAKWLNLIGNEITTADLNDTVKLVVYGDEFRGETINFTIYKNGFWKDKLVVAELSTETFITWNMTEAGNFYFNATILGKTNQTKSGNLEIFPTINNEPPIIEIRKPLNKQIYPLGQLNFSVLLKDRDSVLNYLWDFGDGGKKSGNSLEAKNFVLEFFHNYLTAGQKNILFNVTEGEKIWEKKRILISIPNLAVSDTKNILAYIDFPINEGIFETTLSRFNAQSSFAYTTGLSSGNTQINCIMGNCPQFTDGCFDRALSCSVLSTGCPPGKCRTKITQTSNSYTPANFSWVISKLETSTEEDKQSGFGFYNFSKILQLGNHLTELEVIINSYSSKNKVKFQTGGCSDGRKIFAEIFPDGSIILHNTNESGVCEIYDDKCCESGYSCQDDPNNAGMKKCLPIPSDCPGKLCGNYTNQEDCEEDRCNTGKKIGENKGYEWDRYETNKGIECWIRENGYQHQCEGCVWNESESVCFFNVPIDGNDTPPSSVVDEPDYSCRVLSATGYEDCSSGDDFITYLSTATLVDLDTGLEVTDELIIEETGCIDEFEKKIPCPPKTELPFFGLTQFVICLLGIFGIYFLVKKK